MLYQVKIAVRNIVKHKESYLLNIVGLLIAMVICFITMFYASYEYKYNDLLYTSRNIHHLNTTDEIFGWGDQRVRVGLSEYLSEQVPEVKEVVRYNRTGDFQIQVSPKEVYKEWTFHFIDSNYFQYNRINLESGRQELLYPHDLMLTQQLAMKYFGTIHCIGRELIVHGHQNKEHHFIVSGVFTFPTYAEYRPEYNLIARLDVYEKLHKEFSLRKPGEKLQAQLILNDNADFQNIISHVKTYYKLNDKSRDLEDLTFSVENISKPSLDEPRVKRAIIISTLILLIAIFNFIIHSNAQFWERCKTIGVKKVAGAMPGQLFKHSFTEGLVISLMCSVVAFVLAFSLLPHIKSFLNDSIRFTIIPKLYIAIFWVLIVMFISVLTSLSTLVLVTRYKVIQLVNKNMVSGEKSKPVTVSLIILQITVFTTMLVFILITSRQMSYMNNKDWGFDSEQLLKISLFDDIKINRYYDLKNRFMQISTVINASGCRHVPPSYSRWVYGHYDKANGLSMVEYNAIDISYISTLGVKLKSGRDFNNIDDKLGDKKLIVNQEYLNVKEIRNPYDTLVKIDDRTGLEQIIGVMDDYHMRGMDTEIGPLLFRAAFQDYKAVLIRIAPNNVSETLASIEREYRTVFPNSCYNMSFVNDDIENLYQEQQGFNQLMSLYTIISIIIACMGLYGFVINIVNKRIKEVGIRKVNGARIMELIELLNKEFFIWTAVAFLMACPVAYYFVVKWLEDFAYKIDVAWWMFLVAGGALFAIILITISFQTIKVARRNPVEALRYE
ncbi:MAG: FtsX-like permease family protein [Bacteroidales bacterium]|nr:FtsX-like permease family protein [Bacteroidales bacterium]